MVSGPLAQPALFNPTQSLGRIGMDCTQVSITAFQGYVQSARLRQSVCLRAQAERAGGSRTYEGRGLSILNRRMRMSKYGNFDLNQ